MSDFERVYYQLNIRLASPLSVGSGESESTDHDVFVDGNGNPVIPATSIAGVLRAFFDDDTAKALFGKSAFDLATAVLPMDFFILLGLEIIPPNEIILRPSLLK